MLLIKNKSEFGIQIHSLVTDKCICLTDASVGHSANTFVLTAEKLSENFCLNLTRVILLYIKKRNQTGEL